MRSQTFCKPKLGAHVLDEGLVLRTRNSQNLVARSTPRWREGPGSECLLHKTRPRWHISTTEGGPTSPGTWETYLTAWNALCSPQDGGYSRTNVAGGGAAGAAGSGTRPSLAAPARSLALPMGLSSPSPRSSHERRENTHPHQDVHTHAHSSLIPNSPELETSRSLSINTGEKTKLGHILEHILSNPNHPN